MKVFRINFNLIFQLVIIQFVQAAVVFADEIVVSNALELQNAITSVSDGDTIILESGNYDKLTIANRNNGAAVLIKAQNNAAPVFSGIKITNSKHWTLSGLAIKPRFSNGADGNNALELNGEYLVFENSIINYSDEISSWTKSDWVGRAGNGISMDGSHLTVRNNIISNVAFGINSGATDSIVSGNSIVNFRGDGIRGLGDRMTYEYNTIKNAYAVDDNHDDGFQSWSVGNGGVGTGVVRDVVLRGNIIINFEDPGQNMKSSLQGIGLFDGTFERWTIENNLVVTDHWHGISMYGAKDCRVLNNTVLDLNAASPGPPWIMITNHKNGAPSANVIVRNNLATDFSLGTGVTADHNIEIKMNELGVYFVDPAEGNYHLNSTSPAINAGSPSNAPSVDIEQKKRPQGITWDIGAYEFSFPIVPSIYNLLLDDK